jgi:hypothetical protein
VVLSPSVPLALSRPRKGEGRGQVNVGSRSTLARTLWRPLSLPNVCGATHDMPFIAPIIYKITPWHTKVRVVGGGTKAKRPQTIQKSQIAPSFYFFPCIFVAFSAWRLATALPEIFEHARKEGLRPCCPSCAPPSAHIAMSWGKMERAQVGKGRQKPAKLEQ